MAEEVAASKELWVRIKRGGGKGGVDVDVFDETCVNLVSEDCEPQNITKTPESNPEPGSPAVMFHKNPVCFWHGGVLYCR